MGTRRPARGEGITGSALGTSTGPTSLPVTALAHNPRNPRTNLDDVAELADSIREMGMILQPLVVVRYEIFLSHYPDCEKDVGSVEWVVINGNRRLAAARLLGLAEVPVRVGDELGRANLLDEAVLVENIQRADLPPLREAAAIQALVDRHKSQTAVARRLGKTKGFISQRLTLLELIPEMRDALEAGELSLRDARDLGRLPADEQVAAWHQRLAQRQQTPPTEAGDHPPETAATPPLAAPPEATPVYPVNRSQRRPTSRMPSDDAPAVVSYLREHLSAATLAEVLQLLTHGPQPEPLAEASPPQTGPQPRPSP